MTRTLHTDDNPDTRLLRWYPAAWRSRYGEEMAALIEDDLEGAQPSARLKVSLAARGLIEHARAVVLPGRGVGGQPIRDGSLVVLCAFAVYCWAGLSFQKLTEHFASSMPPNTQSFANGSLTALQSIAPVAGLIVLLGAALAVPAAVRFVRDEGWRAISRPVIAALSASVVCLTGVVILVIWSAQLTSAQRNGSDAAYTALFVATAIVLGIVIALWARVAVRIGQRVSLSSTTLGITGAFAVAVFLAMTAMTVLAAVWWGAVADVAPQIVDGGSRSTATVPVDPQLALTMALMVGATIVGACGGIAIIRGRRLASA